MAFEDDKKNSFIPGPLPRLPGGGGGSARPDDGGFGAADPESPGAPGSSGLSESSESASEAGGSFFQSGAASTGEADDASLLTQEEIDSLLGSDPTPEKEEAGLRSLLSTSRVTRERMPMLEVIYERFVRVVSNSLRHFTTENVEVSLDGGVSSVRFGDYLNQIPVPAMMMVFKTQEWDSYGLINVNNQLVYSMVDLLLGGRRTQQVRVIPRAYTQIEASLVEKMVALILEDLSASFAPVTPMTFRYERMETNPVFVSIARTTNVAVLARFYVDIESRGGSFDIVLPYVTLEPVRPYLSQLLQGEKLGKDHAWQNHVKDSVETSELELWAILADFRQKLGEVAAWRAGDILNLRMTEEADIVLTSEGVDLFKGKLGRLNNNLAVQVTGRVSKKGE